ncbi:WxcM-like domain-containing protein [Pseudomonas parakoreensis]
MLVFASEHYMADDYIRDYDQFLIEKKQQAVS